MSFATDVTAWLNAGTTLKSALESLEAAATDYETKRAAAEASARADATALTVTATPQELVADSRGATRGYVKSLLARLYPDAEHFPAAGPFTPPTIVDGKTAYKLTKGAQGTP